MEESLNNNNKKEIDKPNEDDIIIKKWSYHPASFKVVYSFLEKYFFHIAFQS